METQQGDGTLGHRYVQPGTDRVSATVERTVSRERRRWGQAGVGWAVTPGCSTPISEAVVSSRLMNHTITAMIRGLAWQQGCPSGSRSHASSCQANPLFPVGPFPRQRVPGPMSPAGSPLPKVRFSPSPVLSLVPRAQQVMSLLSCRWPQSQPLLGSFHTNPPGWAWATAQTSIPHLWRPANGLGCFCWASGTFTRMAKLSFLSRYTGATTMHPMPGAAGVWLS